MNKWIKKQLNLVKIAQIPPFNEDTIELIIPKREKLPKLEVQLNHFYLIELEDYIINPPPGFSLHSTWNDNKIPKYKFYKCQCIKIMGKMIKILGVAFDYENKLDLDEYWDGWLPLKSIKLLREI